MSAERCLILAAGFGTRMGPIGKRLPKVLWPVFRLTLLELQLRFARRLGVKEVWINLHHQGAQIKSWALGREAFRDVRWLEEQPDILDVGGAIHNLARRPEVGYNGELLVLNADQFAWFTLKQLGDWKNAAANWDVLLLNLPVNSSQGYNAVLSDSHRRFLRVVPNADLPREQVIETYSGNSLVRLNALEPADGPSPFFASVCVPAKRHCHSVLIQAECYWDFGTAQRYVASMQRVLERTASGVDDPFIAFLEEEGAFLRSEFHARTRSYGCDVVGLVHLGTGIPAPDHPPGVVLAGPPTQSMGAALVYEGEIQPLT